MIELVSSLVKEAISWLNRRKKEGPLPKIELYGGNGVFSPYLDIDHNSIGWKIIRVEVLDSNVRECLSQHVIEQTDTGSKGQLGGWRDFCDYPGGAHPVEMIAIHPDCYEAILSFICETPSRIWWKPWKRKKERVPYKYVPGRQPPIIDHPALMGLRSQLRDDLQ